MDLMQKRFSKLSTIRLTRGEKFAGSQLIAAAAGNFPHGIRGRSGMDTSVTAQRERAA